mgnify:CR=1 FL=1
MSAQGVARPTNNQAWMQGPDYNNATPSQGSIAEQNIVVPKSQSQQKQREANMQSREEENPDGPSQNNPMVPAETTNLAMPHQNP